LLTQYGVLPFFLGEGAEPLFLLITSRGTGRWVVPRGGLIAGLSPAESAEREAFEEAGITGVIGAEPAGTYSYVKWRRRRRDLPAAVTLYPFQVHAQSRRWPERRQRDVRWFTRERAVAAVDEPELKALIAGFHPDPACASDQPLPVLVKRRLRWLGAVPTLLRR
jgi:uncharacterized protein